MRKLVVEIGQKNIEGTKKLSDENFVKMVTDPNTKLVVKMMTPETLEDEQCCELAGKLHQLKMPRKDLFGLKLPPNQKMTPLLFVNIVAPMLS